MLVATTAYSFGLDWHNIMQHVMRFHCNPANILQHYNKEQALGVQQKTWHTGKD